MWSLKTQNQTTRVERNGYSFQVGRVRYFGGGGTKVEGVDPYAQTGYRELFNQFSKFLQPNVGGVTPYPGQVVPGPSNLQQTGFDVAGGLSPIASGGQEWFGGQLGAADPGAPGRAAGMAEQGLSQVLQPFDPSTVMEGLAPGKELAMDTFFRDFMPQLKQNMLNRGGTADVGALDKFAVREGKNLSLGLGAQSFPYLFQGQQNALGRQQTGVNQAMTLAGLPSNLLTGAGQVGGMGTDMLSQSLNIGGIQRGIEGEQLQEGFGKWQFEQPWASPWTDVLARLQGAAPQFDYLAQEQGPGLAGMLGPMAASFAGSEAGAAGIAALMAMI